MLFADNCVGSVTPPTTFVVSPNLRCTSLPVSPAKVKPLLVTSVTALFKSPAFTALYALFTSVMSPALATLFRLVPPVIAVKLPSAFFVTDPPVVPAKVTLSRSMIVLVGSFGSVFVLYLTAISSVACCASLTDFN